MQPHGSLVPAGRPTGPTEIAAPDDGPGLVCGDDIDLDIRRSFAVTDLAALTPFTFTRVMQQIVDTSGVPGVTPKQLYQRWWDYFNEGPGLHPLAFHCDDELVAGQPKLGAFPIQCPRPEGVLAATDPFQNPNTNPDAYIPIGVFNRFDVAPLDGSNCGEHRIIFAKRSGLSDTLDRNLIIFEASLPNPNPSCGIEGCRPVAQFWADLSQLDDVADIRDRLEDFYFVDAAGAGPVVHALNYGPRGGQIRTNSFMNGPNIWQLHEFHLDPSCGEQKLCVRPVTLKDNPFAELFQDPSPWKGAGWFQKWFIEQVPNLEVANANQFFIRDAGTFKAGASTSDGDFDNLLLQSQLGFNQGFRDGIKAAISVPGLTPDHILNRMTALSCSGCHEHANFFSGADIGGGLEWQPSLGFVHVSEEFTVDAEFGPRFPLSDALRFLFLPHRKQVMEDFLAETVCDPCTQNNVKKFGKPSPKKFLPDGFDLFDGMTIGGPRSGH